MTVSEAIRQGTEILARASVDTPRLDAQLLAAFILRCRREDLAREPERVLGDVESTAFAAVLDRRARREPLPYITGVQHFYGRPFHVDPSVLIPRPETELLVKLTLERLAGIDGPKVADAGVGSGCVAVTIAAENPAAELFATDISPAAIEIAAGNARELGVSDRIQFLPGDLLAPLPTRAHLHAVVSNPPYVSERELPDLQPEVRDYEPRLALSGVDGAAGDLGTALYPRLFDEACERLLPGGWILVEVGAGQAQTVMLAAGGAGFVDVDAAVDLGGIPRVVMGRRG